MFARLKGTKGLSTFPALWRTMLLQIFCLLVAALFSAHIVLMGFTS